VIDGARWAGDAAGRWLGSRGSAAKRSATRAADAQAVLGRDSDLVALISAEEQEALIPLLGKLEAFVRVRSSLSS
jgi:hypothetical protein